MASLSVKDLLMESLVVLGCCLLHVGQSRQVGSANPPGTDSSIKFKDEINEFIIFLGGLGHVPKDQR